jgi:peptidoglycan/LPS O-acetylase OafA/YrhL
MIHPQQGTLGGAVFAAITLHINWLESVHGYLPANWDVLWSLSVEEMFYLFFPLLCRWTRGPRGFAVALIALILIGPFARTVLTGNTLWADYGYLSCMDGIALGCLAAMLAPFIPAHRNFLSGMLATGSALMLLVMTARPAVRWLRLYQAGLDTTALALGTSLTLIALFRMNPRGSWLTAPLRWFGRNSYEVYLTHMFVVTMGVRVFVAKGVPIAWAPCAYVAMVLLAGLLGTAVARWYSEPLNRWLRRDWWLAGI